MTRRADLPAALEAVYDAFADYPAPTTLDASPKHNVPEVLERLCSAPLRLLPAEALGAFAGSAIYTIGGVPDYKHFLPRILDLSLSDNEWMGLSPQAIANKLVYAGLRGWPDAEQAAVRNLFSAAWYFLRDVGTEVGNAEAQLCANALIGTDIAALLGDWPPATTAGAVWQMAEVAQQAARDLTNADDAPYWKDASPTARSAVEAWVRRPDVREALTNGRQLLSTEDTWPIELALQMINELSDGVRH